jgi:hypothetical protein
MHFTAPISMVGITALATHCPHLRRVSAAVEVVVNQHLYNQYVLPGRKLKVMRNLPLVPSGRRRQGR